MIHVQELRQKLIEILNNKSNPHIIERLVKELLSKLGIEVHKATIDGEFKRMN